MSRQVSSSDQKLSVQKRRDVQTVQRFTRKVNIDVKTQNISADQIPRKPTPLPIILWLQKKISQKLTSSFFRLALNKNMAENTKITMRYLNSTIQGRVKVNQSIAFRKLRSNVQRGKNLTNFVKTLSFLQQDKSKRYLQYGLNKIVRNSFKKKQDEIQSVSEKLSVNNSLSKEPIKRKVPPINRSYQSKKSSSTDKLKTVNSFKNKTEIPDEIQQLKIQNDQLTIMELSEEVREALKKVQRFDRFIYAKQTEKTCFEPLKLELKRLEKIKNVNKNMRGKVFDNELTTTALYNHIKLIHEMSLENIDLKFYKEEQEGIEKKKKQEEFKASLEAKKNRSLKSKGKSQTQIKRLGDLIDQFVKEKQYRKAHKDIQLLLKKYGKDTLIEDKVHIYQAVDQLLTDNIEMQKILKEITEILEALSIADLRQIEPCLRSLNGNHTKFTFISKQYKDHQKFHGKQMINILHNLQRFNDDIIKYLEEKKKSQIATYNTLEVSRSIVTEKDAVISNVSKRTEDVKKRLAHVQVELQKSKFKIGQLQNLNAGYQQQKKKQKDFQIKFNKILDKIKRKMPWQHQFELLKKNDEFIAEKPYTLFFHFEESIQLYNDSNRKQQIDNIDSILQSIQKLFREGHLSHEMRFQQVSRLVQNSGKMNVHLVEVFKKVQLLLLTVMEHTRSQNDQRKLKALNQGKHQMEQSLSVQKQRARRLSVQVQELKQAQLRNSRSVIKQSKQMNKLIEMIDDFFHNRDLKKAQTQIHIFLKKYGQEQHLKEKLRYYQVIGEIIGDNNQMEKILKQIAQILETLSIADLNQVEACLRSLKGNHPKFIFIKRQYKNHDKFHGKQMINILHNLQRFNDDIIKYLEQKKQIKKISANTLEISRSMVSEKNIAVMQANKKTDELKKKLAIAQVQIQRAKFKIGQLESIRDQCDQDSKKLKEFQIKFSKLLDKINKKMDWYHDFDVLKKDPFFIAERPYSFFFVFEESIEHYYDNLKIKQFIKFEEVFDLMRKIFREPHLSHAQKFQKTSQLIQNSGKKHIQMIEILKKLDLVLITVMQHSEADYNQLRVELQKNVSKLEKQLKAQKLKNSKLNESLSRTPPKPQNNRNESAEKLNRQKKIISDFQTKVKQLQSQKQKFEKESKELRESLNQYTLFEKKFGTVVDRMEKKGNWSKDLGVLLNDEKFTEFKLLINLNTFMDSLKSSQDVEQNKKYTKAENTFASITRVFEKRTITIEKQRIEITRILQDALKKDPQNFALQFLNTVVLRILEAANSESQPSTPKKPIISKEQKQRQKKLNLLSSENKKLTQSIQNERSKSKDLSEKFQSLQKLEREKSQKILIFEKQKNKQKQIKEKDIKIKQLQSQKQKLENESKELRESLNQYTLFERKFGIVVDRMGKKGNWTKDLEALTNDQKLTEFKLLINLNTFMDSLKSSQDIQQSKKNAKAENVFGSITRIFEKRTITIEKQRIEITKILQDALKNDPQNFAIQFLNTVVLRILEAANAQPIESPQKIKQQKQKQNKLNLLSSQNKKLTEMIEKEGIKTKQLNEKLRALEKLQKEKSQQLITLEKQKDRQKQTREKQIYAEKNQEISKYQQANRNISQQFKQLTQKYSQEDRYQQNFYKDIKITTETTSKLISRKNYNKIETQLTKLINKYEKQQKFTVLLETWKSLIINMANESQQKTKIQANTKFDELIKIIRKTLAQVNRGNYLKNQKYWQKLFQRQIAEDSSLNQYIELLNLFQNKINEKNRSYQQLSQKNKNYISLVKVITQILRSLERQIPKKQYFTNQQCWDRLKINKIQDPLYDQLFRVLETFSRVSKQTINQQKTTNEKLKGKMNEEQTKFNMKISELQQTINAKDSSVKNLTKSNTNISELQKIISTKDNQIRNLTKFNKNINELENIIASKDNQNEKIYQELIQCQKKLQENPPVDKSLRSSRKSFRSRTPEKDKSELEILKTKIQEYAREQKVLLQNIASFEQQTHELNKNLILQKKRRQEIENSLSKQDQIFSLQLKKVTESRQQVMKQYHVQFEKTKEQFISEIHQLRLQLLEYQTKADHLQQLQELRRSYYLKQQEIQKVIRQKDRKTTEQINKALKTQQTDFNTYLEKRERQILEKYKQSSELEALRSHTDCQNRYRKLEDKNHDLIYEHSSKIDSAKSEHSLSMDRLRESMSSLKLEVREKDLILSNQTSIKQRLRRELQDKQVQIRKIRQDKDLVIADKQHINKQLYDQRLQLQRVKIRESQLRRELQRERDRINEHRETTITIPTPIATNNNCSRIVQLQAQLTNKTLQIRQLEQIIDHKKKDFDDEREKYYNAERQFSHIKQSLFKAQSQINSLETHNFNLQTQSKSLHYKNQSLQKQLSHSHDQSQEYRTKIIQMQNKQQIMRSDFVRAKTGNQHQYHQKQSRALREQILSLKNQISKLSQFKEEQHYDRSRIQNDKQKIKQMITTRQYNRGQSNQYYDEAELEVLKRINQQVSQLVQANRSLQTKCILLESESMLSTESTEVISVFSNFQEILDGIISFLIDNSLIHSSESYQKYLLASQQALESRDFSVYFEHLSQFLKALFLTANDLQIQEIERKNQQLGHLRQKIDDMSERQLQYNQDESYGALEKYKLIFTDVKFLLKQYLRLRDEEYLNMVCRSLAIDGSK